MEFVVAPILLIGLVIFVAWPILKEEPEVEVSDEPSDLERAIEEKDLAIATLKDIEMDYRMGKLSEEDYARLKEDFEAQALEALEYVDSLEKKKRN